MTDLYNGIYRVLANDTDVLNYLGVDTTLPSNQLLLEKARRIQKRSKPQRLAENLPMITFFAPPGRRSPKNHLVYNTVFVFDVYTNDDVNLAHRIGDKIMELFDGEIHPMMGLESYEQIFETAHESSTDSQDTYCFTVVIEFSVSLDKN